MRWPFVLLLAGGLAFGILGFRALGFERAEAERRARLDLERALDEAVVRALSLAEIYQEMGQMEDSISVYEDIAANASNPDWKQAAIERAKILRSETQ